MKRQKATYPDVGLDLNHDNRFMGYHGSRWLLWSARVEYISVVLRLAFARLRFLEPVPCCILRLRFRRQDTHDIRNGNILVLLVFQENGWQGGGTDSTIGSTKTYTPLAAAATSDFSQV